MVETVQSTRRKLFQNASSEVAALRALAAKPAGDNYRRTLEGMARRLDLALELLRHCENDSATRRVPADGSTRSMDANADARTSGD